MDIDLVKMFLMDPHESTRKFTVLHDMFGPTSVNAGMALVASRKRFPKTFTEKQIADEIKSEYQYFAFYELNEDDPEYFIIRGAFLTQEQVDNKQSITEISSHDNSQRTT